METKNLKSNSNEQRGRRAPPPVTGRQADAFEPSTVCSRTPWWLPELPAAAWGRFRLKWGLEWFSLASSVTSGWNWVRSLDGRVSACVCAAELLLCYSIMVRCYFGLCFCRRTKDSFQAEKRKRDIWPDVIRMMLAAAAADADWRLVGRGWRLSGFPTWFCPPRPSSARRPSSAPSGWPPAPPPSGGSGQSWLLSLVLLLPSAGRCRSAERK